MQGPFFKGFRKPFLVALMFTLPLAVILLGWALAGGSPGPATLTISATSMAQGRGAGLAVASGVIVGSACWGIAAALGFSALMVANVWLFDAIRIGGALYLLWLALKSLRAAWVGAAAKPVKSPRGGFFAKGLALHLTNPKAVLAWGSIYAVVIAPGAGAGAVPILFGALILTSMVVFWGYAVLFSAPRVARGYAAAKRLFDTAFGLLFGAAALKLLGMNSP